MTIVSADFYSTKINFTFGGEDSFKTLIGGVISLIISMIVLSITLTLTVTIFQKSNVTSSINKIFKDITNDQTKHYFAKEDVYFAFRKQIKDKCF